MSPFSDHLSIVYLSLNSNIIQLHVFSVGVCINNRHILWYSNAVLGGGPTGIFKRQKITILSRFSYAATRNLSWQYWQTIKIDKKLATVIVLYFPCVIEERNLFQYLFFFSDCAKQNEKTKIISRNTKLCAGVTCRQCFLNELMDNAWTQALIYLLLCL